MKRVVVIGAGVAGLAVAGLLRREGFAVTVLERHREVGGRAASVTLEGFTFDSGPSWYLMPEAFDHFFAMMGTSTNAQLELLRLNPRYRIFTEPTDKASVADAIDVPDTAAGVTELFEQLEPGSAQTLAQYLASALEAQNLAMKYFLYNPYSDLRSLAVKEVLQKSGRLATLLSTTLDKFTASKFEDARIRQLLQYPAIFLGTDPRRAPALYHLMSNLDLGEGVLYPRGGFAKVVQRLFALANDAGAEFKTQATATEILTSRGRRGAKAVGVRWRDEQGNHHVMAADYVVSAADLHHTETTLLPRSLQSYPERWWQKRTSGPGAVIAMLGVQGRIPELPHHSLLFTRDWAANFDAVFGSGVLPHPASIYVCKPSATDGGVAPSGHENLFMLIPTKADTAIGRGGLHGNGDTLVEQTVDAGIAQLSQWTGIEGLHERVVVRKTLGPGDFAERYNSWRGGMLGPAHTLGQSAMLRAQNTSKRVANLHYAGATVAPGVGVPMCLISAELVVKRILGDKSPGPMNERTGLS